MGACSTNSYKSQAATRRSSDLLRSKGGDQGVGCQLYATNSICASITSHTRAKVSISGQTSQVRELTKFIYLFIKFDDNNGFEDTSVQKDNINFLFLQCIQNIFLGDIIQPAEIALVNMCRKVDSYFSYIVESNTISMGDNDVDSEDDEDYGEIG